MAIFYLQSLSVHFISEFTPQVQLQCAIVGDGRQKRVFRHGKLIAKLLKHQNVWWLSTRLQREYTNAFGLISVHNNTELWHKRLGHLSLQKLQKTATIVRETLTIGKNLDYCEKCVGAKQITTPVSRTSVNKTVHPLERLNMDTVDAERVSRCGKRGFVLITDSVSQLRWTHCYERKSEIAKKIVEFLKLLSNLTEWKIKTIRCDNGTEFKNITLMSYLKNE